MNKLKIWKKLSNAAVSNGKKAFATKVATGASLSPHFFWKYSVAWNLFFSIFSLWLVFTFNLIVNVKLIINSTFQCTHLWFKIYIIGKNMKFEKLSLSPHLNCLSPHVANGDKVGHRWSNVFSFKQMEYNLIFFLNCAKITTIQAKN